MKAKPQKIRKRAPNRAAPAIRGKSTSAKDVCLGIQRSVDTALLSLPPKVQANIDQVLKRLDVSPFRFQDLQALGYRILKHATEISETLKGAKSSAKKTRGQQG